MIEFMSQYGLIPHKIASLEPLLVSALSTSAPISCRQPSRPACYASCCHCCTGCSPLSTYAAAWYLVLPLLLVLLHGQAARQPRCFVPVLPRSSPGHHQSPAVQPHRDIMPQVDFCSTLQGLPSMWLSLQRNTMHPWAAVTWHQWISAAHVLKMPHCTLLMRAQLFKKCGPMQKSHMASPPHHRPLRGLWLAGQYLRQSCSEP